LGSCSKPKGRFCTKKEEDIFDVEKREEESMRVCRRAIKEGVH